MENRSPYIVKVATDYIASGASLLQVGFQELMWHKWSPAQLSGFSKGSPLSSSIMFKIDASGHVLPGGDNVQDLGSFTARWRNIYTADMHFSNEGSENSIDGTWGNWTLQEGEQSIYMLNNRTGRRYKIVLEEV